MKAISISLENLSNGHVRVTGRSQGITVSQKEGPSDLFASGFDLGSLRKRINASIAKAKFNALPKAERDKRATEALEAINQLIK